jgi:hypothetical protein
LLVHPSLCCSTGGSKALRFLLKVTALVSFTLGHVTHLPPSQMECLSDAVWGNSLCAEGVGTW